MADTIVDKMVIGISFDNKQLTNSAKQIESTIGDMSKGISDKLKTALDVFTTGFGLNFAKNLIEGFADTGANLDYLSQSVHENVSTLGMWQQAVIRVGGTADGFNNTIKSLYDRINNAIVHGDPMTTGILNILGINPRSNGQIKQTSVLIKEILQQLHKQPERLRSQFGKQLGLDDATIRLANLSNKELDDLLKKMEKQGLISAQQAKRSVEMKNAWQDVTQVWNMAAFTIAEKLFPDLIKIGNWMSEHPKIVKDVAIAVAGITTAFIGFTSIKLAVTGLTAALGILGSQLGIIVLSATALYEIFKNRDLIKNWAKKEDLQWLVDLMEQLNKTMNDFDKFFKRPIDTLQRAGLLPMSPQQQTQQRTQQKNNLDNYISGVTHGMVSSSNNNLTPYEKAQGYLESRNRNLNTGNGAYGEFQIRENWGRRAWAKVDKAIAAMVNPEWLMNPENNLATHRLMMKQNLVSTKGNLDAATRMYSGGHYGADSVMNVMQRAQKAPQNINNSQSKNTHVSINNMQLQGMNNPNDFVQGLSDPSAEGWTFSGARLA